MDKLKLKHLAPYLPYGLKWGLGEHKYVEFEMAGCYKTRVISTNSNGYATNEKYKPILRPLSDLIKKIKHGDSEFIPSEVIWGWSADEEQAFEIYGEIPSYWESNLKLSHYDLTFRDIEFMFEWHLDVFGLIEKGLAIDINTLEK